MARNFFSKCNFLTVHTGSLFAASLLAALVLLAPSRVLATGQQPAGIVIDADTGAILSSYNIDGPQPPDLAARLMTVIMGIQDMADGTLKPDEKLPIDGETDIYAASAIRATAEGGEIKRIPMTALVSRIGHNPMLLQERMFSLSKRIGMRGSRLEIHRAPDGGPAFIGGTTVRDTARLMTSLIRAHGDSTRAIFSRTVVNIPSGEVWMTEDGNCLMVRVAQKASRRLVSVVSGQKSDAKCLEKSMEITDAADARLYGIAMERSRTSRLREASR